MKVIIAMLENLQGDLDNGLPFLVQQIVIEIQSSSNNKTPSNYKSMLF
jgi:hypothetical protein